MAEAPLLVHRFSVRIEGGASRPAAQTLQFAEVVLPEVVADRAAARRAKPSFTNLTLRRAVQEDQQLGAWMREGLPRDVVVILLDERNEPAVQWRAKSATPVRWSHSPLNATLDAQVAIESLELTVEDFDRIQ
jgi:phage tail-like protein